MDLTERLSAVDLSKRDSLESPVVESPLDGACHDSDTEVSCMSAIVNCEPSCAKLIIFKSVSKPKTADLGNRCAHHIDLNKWPSRP